MFTTPILLISWKRPEKTRKVLNAIRKVQPNKLYLACDGANYKDKIIHSKVQMTRAILDNNIDWNCEV